jgi:REP element-mobilizing transposase RayT
MQRPLAYHITFGSYETRLHGDERGTVDRAMNKPGDPIIGRDDAWNQIEHDKLTFQLRVFTVEQMTEIERHLPMVCERGGWKHHTGAAGPDHVHEVLTGDADGAAIRKWLKRWVGEELAKRNPLLSGESFWAECGSVKWIWTEEYLGRARDDVFDQRATERHRAP